jgi:hypothetical protein
LEQNREIKFEVKLSIVEIYKEGLYDLLRPETRSTDLKIKEHPKRGIYVQNLTEEYVADREEVLDMLTEAERYRVVSETMLNKSSSRSHLLLILEITQKTPDGIEKRGTLNLVDLAGSEKISKSGAVGETLEEAKKINLSLSTLGNVISALTTLNKEYVPYRDSKLTRILQDSLGGNYNTTLIVTCSPHVFHYEETLSTLKFAGRAKKIKNTAKINIKRSNEELENIVAKLTKELKEAKQELVKIKSFNGTHETTPNIATPKSSCESIMENENLIAKNIATIEAKLKDEEIKMLKKEIEVLKEENEELNNKIHTLSKEQNLDRHIKNLEDLVKINISEISELKYNITNRQDEILLNENKKLRDYIEEMNIKYFDVLKKVDSFKEIITEDEKIDYFNKGLRDIDQSHHSELFMRHFNLPQQKTKLENFLLKFKEEDLEPYGDAYLSIFEHNKSFLNKILDDFMNNKDYFKTFKLNLDDSLTKLNYDNFQKDKTNKLKNSFINLNLVTLFYEKLLYDVLNKVLLDTKKFNMAEKSNNEFLSKLDGFSSLLSNYMNLLNEFKNLKAENFDSNRRDTPIYKGNIIKPVSRSPKKYTRRLSGGGIEFVNGHSNRMSFAGEMDSIREVIENITERDLPSVDTDILADQTPKIDPEYLRRVSQQVTSRIRMRKKSVDVKEINENVIGNFLGRLNVMPECAGPELKYIVAELNLYKNFLNVILDENKKLKEKNIDINEIIRQFQENYRHVYEQEILNYKDITNVLKNMFDEEIANKTEIIEKLSTLVDNICVK